jgi:predicted protein tyrosine phosphatase
VGELPVNRALVVGNNAQGDFPRVLAVCSAGVLRSPTIAWVLSNPPFNFNTRSCGCEADYALIQMDYALLQWAEYGIVCAEDWQMWLVEDKLKLAGLERDVFSLGISDDFDYRDPALVKMIMERCLELFINTTM